MVTIAGYADLKNKQQELIRKALQGSVFLAPVTAAAIVNLTVATGVAPNEVIDLAPLDPEYDDLGWLTDEGAAFSREVAQAETTSWGSVTPTRTDITSDTATLTVVAQETKLLTIGMATGADLASMVPAVGTGEVRINKPARPSPKRYRVLSLAVDDTENGEIYIGRFMPRAKTTNYAEQAFNGGEVTWGVTLTGEEDSTLGFSEAWLFGGPGWKANLLKMGFTP